MSRTIDMNKLRAGRALAGLSIREVAQRAGVNASTVQRLERGDVVKSESVTSIQRVIEAAGVVLLDKRVGSRMLSGAVLGKGHGGNGGAET